MAEDFANAIINKQIPLADFNSGLAVIKILEAASRSIKDHGKEIVIK
jgi:predicted dehydrogenase